MGALISILGTIIAIFLVVGFIGWIITFLRFIWGCLRGEGMNPLKGWWD